MATVTALEGGHVTSLEASNDVIKQIVEARNKSREPSVSLSDVEVVEEIQEELKKACDMADVSPPNVFDENPKDLIGSGKIPLHLWPTTASAAGSIALLNGAMKYGRSNWRKIGVRASIYVDACQRHLSAWFEGHEEDEEGVPHLSAALACLAILVDCQAAGKLRDDRQFPGGHSEFMDAMTKKVTHLKSLHESKSPKHYTIADRDA